MSYWDNKRVIFTSKIKKMFLSTYASKKSKLFCKDEEIVSFAGVT